MLMTSLMTYRRSSYQPAQDNEGNGFQYESCGVDEMDSMCTEGFDDVRQFCKVITIVRVTDDVDMTGSKEKESSDQ